METLYELAKFNLNYKPIIEALIPKEDQSPLKNLYKIVQSDRIVNDKQAMMAIYGNAKLSTFTRLKTRLKDILIKTTLLHSDSQEPEHSRVNESFNLYRHTIASKFLTQQKLPFLSIRISERALSKSIKYGSTENVILLIRMLIRHFGSREHNKNKLNEYLAIQEKYLRIYYWEIKAENYYLDLQRLQVHSFAAVDKSIINKVKEYVNELEKVNDIDTYLFLDLRYKIKIALFEYQNDFESILKLSDATIKEFNTTKKGSKVIIQNINIRKAWALVQAGRYNEAKLLGTKGMKSMPSGSFGWFFIAHYKLKAQLYNGDYKDATILIKSVIEAANFSKIAQGYKEIFYTTLGYIHLIINAGLAGDPIKIVKVLPAFKIGKFLNTIPVFSKDKQGINVSILLMHIGFLLQRKNYNAIIDRIDSLKQYAYKYLRKDDTFRSNCMIKMVVQMTKADFNPIRTERYTIDLYKQLQQVKLAGSGENIETEIIPYEVLWGIMKKAIQ